MAVRLPKGLADRRPIVREATPVELTVAAAMLVELITEAPPPTGTPIMVRTMAGGESPRLSPVWRLAQCWRLCPPGPSPRYWGVRHTTMTAATIIRPAIRALTLITVWSRIPISRAASLQSEAERVERENS